MPIHSLLGPKTLLNTIIVVCILAAATTLLQLWLSPFSSEIFWKLLLSYGLVATTIAILKAILSDGSEAGERRKDTILVVTVSLAGIICLLQLWFSAFNNSIFAKLLTTFCVIIALISIIRAVRSDLDDEATKKKDNYFN